MNQPFVARSLEIQKMHCRNALLLLLCGRWARTASAWCDPMLHDDTKILLDSLNVDVANQLPATQLRGYQWWRSMPETDDAGQL